MIISGFQNTTLLDFPGRVASTVFTGGCNFRCPFCHNASLVIDPVKDYEEEDILKFFAKRKGILDGVCVTGGEPTLQRDLPEFLYKIKSLGLAVKLDSNGYRPEVLKQLYEGNLIDYVAMDIKASPALYGRAAGLEDFDIKRIEESVAFIMSCGVDYEFRTTLVKGLHNLSDMDGIGALIKGAKAYFLQSYKDNEEIVAKRLGQKAAFEAFTEAELEKFREKACGYVPNTNIRGV